MTSNQPPFAPIPGLVPGSLIYSPKVRQASVVRKQVGQYDPDQVGIRILDKYAQLIDPDPGSLRITIQQSVDYETGDGPVIPPLLSGTEMSGVIERVDIGIYKSFLSPGLTDTLGIFEVLWHYRVAGQEYSYRDYFQVQDPMPIYSSLTDDEKGLVEQVSWLFGDLYDSTEGGPHLIEEFQTHFGFERIAQLMYIAMNRINLTRQPISTFTIGNGPGGGILPSGSYDSSPLSTSPAHALPGKWYGVLVQGTFVEVLRHLVRSYAEQPIIQGLTVATLDRRDYQQRWQSVLADAQEDFKQMMIYFKRDLLNLGGGGSLIIAGGLWGKGRFYGNTYSAMVRGYRFFPASMAAGSGLYGH